MFISVVRSTDGREHSSMYQCDRFHVHPTDDPSEWTVTMERDGSREANSFTYNIREAIGVYALNDRGRTIDRLFVNHEAMARASKAAAELVG